jgi:hypothetical protein
VRAIRFNKQLMPFAFAAAFALLGAAFLLFTKAATPSWSVEAESDTLGLNTTIVTDATASGGSSILFQAAATPTPTLTPTPGPVTCTTNVTTSTFASAVSAASAGAVLCLANGNYGQWAGTNKAITITNQPGASPTLSLSLRSGDCCFTIDGGRSTLDKSEPGIIINGDGGPSIGAGVSNIVIKNTSFTSGFRIDGPTNANILFDHNIHANLDGNAHTAAIHLSYGSAQPSGVTIQNSLFRDMSSDGIQTGLGVNIINNEFARIQPANPEQHTDAIQSVGGGGITIRGNFIHEGEQAIGMFDGTGGNIIEHNVIKNFSAHWISLGGDRPGSVVQFNTLVGTGARLISCPSKSGYQSSQTTIRNNIAGDIELSGTVNCTPTVNSKNLLSSGASGLNIAGSPIFVGGSNPGSYLGYLLANNSPGRAAATDGSDVGIHQQ